jgi:ribosome maturation factor RimP
MDNKTLENLLKECGVSLYDTETVTENDHKIYRVYITSKDGINLDKCTEVTKILSPIFDLEPPVSGEYFLEVSSPGIERKLTEPKHFKNSIGELVKIKHTELGKLKGEIVSSDNESVTIKDKADKEEKKLSFGDILQAKTFYSW